MDFSLLADGLWYSGHVLTCVLSNEHLTSGVAIIVNHHSYHIAVACVFIGQFLTIISRLFWKNKEG